MIFIPYPNFHAARVHDPKNYDSFTNKEIADGIQAIFGIKDGKSEIQAYRFDKAKFSEEEAKKWLEEHDVKPISFEKAVKTNAEELTPEYLRAVYDHLMEHPDIFEHIKEQIHLKARASAGGKLKGKNAIPEDLPETNALRINASQYGGKIIESSDEITVIPAVLMAEGVRNGGLQRYEDFSKDYRWFEGVPIVPPHKPGDLATHKTKKLGQIRNVKLNAEKRRIEAEAVLFNDEINPDDIRRIQAGESFGGSVGFWADDEPLNTSQTWSDGKPYNRVEKNFFGDHFSIVPDPACPLGTCGFNVNSEESSMVEEKKPEEAKVEIKTNAEEKPIEAPKVNIDLSVLLTKMDALSTDMAALKANVAAKDDEISKLKAAEEVRINAQKATEDKLIADFVESHILAAHKAEVASIVPDFKVNAALFFSKYADKIDWASFRPPQKIEPAGVGFVPHVNAADEDPYEAAGAKAAEGMIPAEVK